MAPSGKEAPKDAAAARQALIQEVRQQVALATSQATVEVRVFSLS